MSKLHARKKARRLSVGQLLLTLFMLLLAMTMLIPILNIIANSFSDPMKSPYMSGLRVIPDGFSLLNYSLVLSNTTIIPALWNSVKITVVGTAINILLTT
ncbi:MAG: carbohydrate ABC transporter permease, partial [Clostridiales bacterium]|nr:carbohydrate ABC transporter permease [Clostridiales bacterium]